MIINVSTFNRRNNLTLQVAFAVVLISGMLLAGCAKKHIVPYTLEATSPSLLTMPEGYYQDVAWLQSNVLALEHMESLLTKNWDTRLMIFDIASNEVDLLPDEVPTTCYETRYGRLGRLPDGRLGYLYECIPHKGIARDFRLHAWDVKTQADEELYQYPIPFWATEFAFSLGMNRWLQEGQGDGIFNKLYLVTKENPPVRLLEESFARVGWPVWLPDERILFAGTPQLPESHPNLFSSLPSLARKMDTPWNIYLTDLALLQNGAVTDTQLVLANVVGLQLLRVSTDGNRIAFLGTYDGHTGLWIYDLPGQQLVRIWDEFGPFDWSPDGTKLVVLVRDPEAEFFAGHPAIIEVARSLTNSS